MFGKKTSNCVFLSETGEIIEIMSVIRCEINYLGIMSICQYKTVTTQKILIYDDSIHIFIKKMI